MTQLDWKKADQKVPPLDMYILCVDFERKRYFVGYLTKGFRGMATYSDCECIDVRVDYWTEIIGPLPTALD